MSEPIWIETSSVDAAQDLALALARHGLRGVPSAAGGTWFVRVPGSSEAAPQLLRDLAVALESSRDALRSDGSRRRSDPLGHGHDDVRAALLTV